MNPFCWISHSGRRRMPFVSAAVSVGWSGLLEMMVGFFNVVFDRDMPLKNLFAPTKKPRAEVAR